MSASFMRGVVPPRAPRLKALFMRGVPPRAPRLKAPYQPGDIVVRRKGLFMHHGIVLDDGRILHNTPRKGEHLSSEQEFRAGRRMRIIRLEEQAQQRSLGAATEGAGRPYNLFTNNCEHCVSRAATGQARSPQLQGWMAGLGVAALAFAATRRPAAAVAGYMLGRSLARQLGNLARRRRQARAQGR